MVPRYVVNVNVDTVILSTQLYTYTHLPQFYNLNSSSKSPKLQTVTEISDSSIDSYPAIGIKPLTSNPRTNYTQILNNRV
jgi:hypothetical protein